MLNSVSQKAKTVRIYSPYSRSLKILIPPCPCPGLPSFPTQEACSRRLILKQSSAHVCVLSDSSYCSESWSFPSHHSIQTSHSIYNHRFFVFSQVMKILGQKAIHLSTQIFSHANLVHTLQLSEASVLRRTHGCYSFHVLALYSVSLFAQGRRCSGFELIHDNFLFHFVGTCISSNFW